MTQIKDNNKKIKFANENHHKYNQRKGQITQFVVAKFTYE